MKKSEIFRKAQFAILKDEELLIREKLEIIEALIKEEKLVRYIEEREESEERDNG